jgi:kynurenine 3-monooxygenase
VKKIKNISIVGAGLVGSLLAIYLRKRGYNVAVFERRADIRRSDVNTGRSINLALSTRGIKALEENGLDAGIRKIAIPMHGRMVHNANGTLAFQPYGKQGEFINSISRNALNGMLMYEAERLGVEFFFEHRCQQADHTNTILEMKRGSEKIMRPSDLIVGADGAFSCVRLAMQMTDRFNYSQDYIEHGYKEFHIPPGEGGAFRMEQHALHIWPRQSFMLIALPNPDGSFTCTLFFPLDGPQSFASLKSDADITTFFQTEFPDAHALIPALVKEFHENPTGTLVSIKCYPWVQHNTFLLGDAAHAIVPFYGQGMNAGFEDCRVLNRLLDEHKDDWEVVLPLYQQLRKPDTDTISRLAHENFVEMRDHVADPDFLLRKKIEAKLHELYPDRWIPLYSMVTFHDNIRYSDAYRTGQRQKQIMDEVMKRPDIRTGWETLDFAAVVCQLG